MGKQSRTSVSIVYMDNIADKELVEEVKERLLNINIDHALQAGFVEEFIIDHRMTAFPLVVYTERPDKFSANILSGRVGIIIDGLPIGIIAPGTFVQFLQAPEDYAQNWIVSSLINVIRYMMLLVALFLPAFYIAVTTFHQEMIPSELAIAISASKEGVPFPSFIEVLIMLLAFEVLLEAGLRLPKAIGQSVSIVGAIVVGQAAVEARLISPAVLVAIAFTAIASFTIPNQDFSNAIRTWRLLMALSSSILGLYGLSICTLYLLNHLCKMESFGVPYLSPFVSCEGRQIVYDAFLRLPLWYHKSRPRELRTVNKRRQGG